MKIGPSFPSTLGSGLCLLLTLSSHERPKQTLWDYWWALIRWHGMPNCFKCLIQLMIWSRATMAVCLTYWVHSLASCGSVSPPTHPLTCITHDIAGCVQKVSKPASPTSSYICVTVMITIALLYFLYKSYEATIKHKEAIILWVFQICISWNPRMCVHGSFSKSGHIL